MEAFYTLIYCLNILELFFFLPKGGKQKVVMSRFNKDLVCLFNNLSKEILLCIFYDSSRYANACAINAHS